MITILRSIKMFLEFFRCSLHLFISYIHPNKSIIHADVRRWLEVMKKDYSFPKGLIYLLGFHAPFRNLYYYRIGTVGYILNIICPGMSTLIIATKEIGEGLYISHGFATSIGAESIGKNCWINQNVTIGHYRGNNVPIIKDNVIIRSGAVILGKVTVGSNVVIGANATVIKDIPDNCTVFPPPSMIMKWDSKIH